MQGCYTPGKLDNAGAGVKGEGDMGCTNDCAECGYNRTFVDPVANCSFPCPAKRASEQGTIIGGNNSWDVVCAEAKVCFLSKFRGEKVGMLEDVMVGANSSSKHSFREEERFAGFA